MLRLSPKHLAPSRLEPALKRAAAIGLGSILGAAACTKGDLERRGAIRIFTPDPDAGAKAHAGEPEPPLWTLSPSARHFERDGIQAPVLMRNLSAASAAAFAPLLAAAADAGTRVVRVQITQGFGYQTLGMARGGGVLPGWANEWDAVFDEAARRDLGIIVVFSLWGDWNDGEPALGWSHFDANPLSRALGGPASSPADLFADTEARRLWLEWISELVRRWSSRPNIIAWEIFSELDLASGATESGGVELVERAHELIREIEPWRPVFASTSDLPLIAGLPWHSLWSSPANAIVSIHPYAHDLDRVAVNRVGEVWSLTNRPVLIAESGLDAAAPDGTTLTSGERAGAGLSHAVWAGLISGSMSARAFYWEDSYAAYYPQTGLPLVQRFSELEREAARWLAGKDFRGLAPASVAGEPPLFGSAVTGSERVLGWARQAELMPPDWSATPLPRATLRVDLPPDAPDAQWQVTLTDPETGARTETSARSSAASLSFEVEGPLTSVAFEAVRGALLPGPASLCPEVANGVCPGPVYAMALDGQSLFADESCPNARVELHFTQCRQRLQLLVSSCPPEDEEPPRSCVVLYVFDLQAEASGNGTYYDESGAAFEIAVTSAEISAEDLYTESLRSGVVRGTLRDGDAGVRPLEVSFSGCSTPASVCLR